MKKLIKTVDGFNIFFEALEEHLGVEDMFSEPEDIKEINEKLNNYEFTMFCAKVTAEKEGIELGSDYLGACIYESEEDFYIKYKDDYFADMVNTVVKEAKKELPILIKKLTN